MGNMLSRIADMEENGILPKFDPNNYVDVINLARERGLRGQVMYTAMDIVRDKKHITNEEAIILSAKKWNLI